MTSSGENEPTVDRTLAGPGNPQLMSIGLELTSTRNVRSQNLEDSVGQGLLRRSDAANIYG